MYKVKLSENDKDALRRGDMYLLRKLLRQSNENIIQDLKKTKGDNVAYLQGASSVIDRLIEVLEV